MIEQKKISLISNKTHKTGGRRILEAIIERDYCLSWFLFGLAQSSLKNILVFKGGTALRRCYFQDYRFSEDLDFTLIQDISFDNLLKQFKDIFSWVKDESGIVFDHVKQDPPSENTFTFYLSYVGPLPGAPREVKVDVTFKEIILTAIKEKAIIKTYEEYDDFLPNSKIKVYSLEEVAIEKVCALFAPDRNEPRDLYDIYKLVEDKGIDISQLVPFIENKLEFKGVSLEKRRGEFSKKEKRLEKLWDKRLSQQMSSLPEFDGVFRIVKRAFRQAGLLSRD